MADRVAPGMQLDRLAAQLGAVLGVVPRRNAAADLVRTLYRLARDEKVLAVIDEFPYLLGTTAAEQQRTLTAIQAVMEEEREHSRLKLVLTGSTVAVMESLQAEHNPMHGRLLPMPVRPLNYRHAQEFLHDTSPVVRIARFSVAGGMPRYLSALADGSLLDAVTAQIVDPYAPLFNEPSTLLAAELREPTVYFSILAALARRPQTAADVGATVHAPTQELTGYLHTLESLHLVSRHRPAGTDRPTRSTQWRCDDDFVRFWFRFVHPHRGALESGIDPRAFVGAQVAPHLGDHAAPTFERILEDWVRAFHGAEAPGVGAWWGPALHPLRRTKQRFTEEIDCVAMRGRAVAVAAEAKWTTAPMGVDVLHDLFTYKLPAMAQAGHDVGDTHVVLASRSGFTPGLVDAARGRSDVRLVDVETLSADLRP
ncbi:DUF234 domain-containing protein [Isoptericola sp. NPDC019482]|uniref:ATP-binding protein n=1 Tax=Isoptericola sp. NPDC019482 TaxID=3154688 RepID=UPI00348634DF